MGPQSRRTRLGTPVSPGVQGTRPVKTGSFKWWHALLSVAALAAVAWGGYSTLSGGPDQPKFANELTLVDVTSGDLFTFDISGRRAVAYPELNPATGKAALLGVNKAEDGKWYISQRQLHLLEQIKEAPAAVIDRKTGEVRISSERPRRGR